MYVRDKVMHSYFLSPNENSKTIIFVLYNREYQFIGSKTKSHGLSAVMNIVSGLNHLLSWAYDTNQVQFINKFNAFIISMYSKINDQSFVDINASNIREKKYRTSADSSAAQFLQITAMDQEIIEGVVRYVDQNILVNTEDAMRQ